MNNSPAMVDNNKTMRYNPKNHKKGAAEMAFETKVILISLAQHACRTESKEMYKIISEMANAEGTVIKSYEEARAELEE